MDNTVTVPVAETGYRPVRWNINLIFRDMAAKGWTTTKLAARSRVTQQTLMNMKLIGRPTATTIAKIAKALGTKVERYILD